MINDSYTVITRIINIKIQNYRYPNGIYTVITPGRVAQSVGHLTRKSGVLGSIPGLATYFRFSFRFFKNGVVRWCWVNFQCRGVLQFGYSRARAYCARSRCGRVLFGHFYSSILSLLFLPPFGRRPDID